MKNFLGFGKSSIESLVMRLFLYGIIPIALFSYIYVKSYFPSGTAAPVIEHSDYFSNSVDSYITLENSGPSGLLILVVLFISSVFIWKIVCEIILIVLRHFSNKITNKVQE